MSADETSSGTNGTTSGPWVARNWPVVVGVAGALLCATAIIWLIGSSQSEELGAQGALVESEQAEHPEREAIEQTVLGFFGVNDQLVSGPLPSDWRAKMARFAKGSALDLEGRFLAESQRMGYTWTGRSVIRLLRVEPSTPAQSARAQVCLDPSDTQKHRDGQPLPREDYEPRRVDLRLSKARSTWKIHRIEAKPAGGYEPC